MNSQKPLYTDLTNIYGYDLTRQGEYFYSPPPWLLDVHEELTALRARVAELEAKA